MKELNLFLPKKSPSRNNFRVAVIHCLPFKAQLLPFNAAISCQNKEKEM